MHKLIQHNYIRPILTFLLISLGIIILNFKEFFELDYFTTQWDAITRVAASLRHSGNGVDIFSRNFLVASKDWLPLHFVFNQLAVRLFNDVILVIYAHFFLCVMALSILNELLFRQIRNAKNYLIGIAITVAIFQIPTLLYISFTTHVEALYFFSLAGFIYAFQKFKSNKKYLVLVWSFALLLSLCRYEGWIIIAVYVFFYLFNTRNIYAWLKMAPLATGPFLWILGTYLKTKTYFVFVELPLSQAKIAPYLDNYSLSQFLAYALGPVIFMLVFGGIVSIPSQRKLQKILEYKEIIFSGSFIFIQIFIMNLTHNLYYDPRYFATTYFIILFVALAISYTVDWQKKNFLFILIPVLVFAFVPQFLFDQHTRKYSYKDYERPGLRESIEFAKTLDINRNKWFHFVPYRHYSFFYLLLLEKWEFAENRGAYINLSPYRFNEEEAFKGYFDKPIFGKGNTLPYYIAIPKHGKWGKLFEENFSEMLKSYNKIFENEFVKFMEKSPAIKTP